MIFEYEVTLDDVGENEDAEEDEDEDEDAEDEDDAIC